MIGVIKPGSVVSIRHYSGFSPFKSIVTDITEDILTIKLVKNFASMNFLEYDPVVLGYEEQNEIYILGCTVSKIDIANESIVLVIDNYELDNDKRSEERYPVSIYADIKVKEDRKKYLATIKNISFHGMLVNSKVNINTNEPVEVSIYLEKSMLFLNCKIVRCIERDTYFEYGMTVVYEDSYTMTYMKDYIKRLKDEQEFLIRKLY